MTLKALVSFAASPILLITLSGCVTQEDGQLKPILSNMEIGLPVAVANKALGKNAIKTLRGEIRQELNCLRQYPISRIKIMIEATKPEAKEKMKKYFFYPDAWNFQKQMAFDNTSSYRISLIYEPDEKVLLQKIVSVQETIEVFFKIECPAES